MNYCYNIGMWRPTAYAVFTTDTRAPFIMKENNVWKLFTMSNNNIIPDLLQSRIVKTATSSEEINFQKQLIS